MVRITEEWLTHPNKLDGMRNVLSCDVPIWREFCLGKELYGAVNRRTPSARIRELDTRDEESGKWMNIIITPKSRASHDDYLFLEECFKGRAEKGAIKNLTIDHYERCGKDVYVWKYDI